MIHLRHKVNQEIKAYDSIDVAKDFINIDDFNLLSELEVKEIYNPYDFLTEEQKLIIKRSQYPKLKRYQFMRGLLEMGFKSSDIEAQIMLIEDESTRELTMLGFKDAGYFDRNDQSIGVMRDMLKRTDLEIDEFWELCMTF